MVGLSGENRPTKTAEQFEPFVEQMERIALFIVSIPPLLDMQPNARTSALPFRGYTRTVLASVDYAFDLIASGAVHASEAQRVRLSSAREDLDDMLETFNLTVDHFDAIQDAIATDR